MEVRFLIKKGRTVEKLDFTTEIDNPTGIKKVLYEGKEYKVIDIVYVIDGSLYHITMENS